MRVPYLALAAAGAALLAPTTLPAPAVESAAVDSVPAVAPASAVEPVPHGKPVAHGTQVAHGKTATHGRPVTHEEPVAHGAPAMRHEDHEDQEDDVSADDLLAKVRDCAPVSRGRYRTDHGLPARIPVCGTRDAVYWTADMDIDCDGRPGPLCNSRTDPLFSGTTAFQQSDGRHLSAERLPYVVVPAPSRIWDYRASGVRGGSVVAVVHRDRVGYAVVGDVGPQDIIGEASYATAKALGIRPDPRGGGTASDVTYIAFKDTRVTPIEDRAGAVTIGQRLARKFVGDK